MTDESNFKNAKSPQLSNGLTDTVKFGTMTHSRPLRRVRLRTAAAVSKSRKIAIFQ